MTTTTRDHFLVRDIYRGQGGDRPVPWQVTYSCGGCNIELGFDEEGRSDLDLQAALAEHIEEVEQ